MRGLSGGSALVTAEGKSACCQNEQRHPNQAPLRDGGNGLTAIIFEDGKAVNERGYEIDVAVAVHVAATDRRGIGCGIGTDR